MADILHRIAVKTRDITAVHHTLTTLEGLRGWWTEDTTGEPGTVEGIIAFRFMAGGFDMRVKTVTQNLVEWEVVAGEPQWIGSVIRWELKQVDDYVVILFKHEGWKEATEFMHHCSTKWAIFLMSLKDLIEKLKGSPNPRDVKIDEIN
ncbi:SRPBCC family protein [Niabella hibiscisoli]|uniref:SRPBCC family protein n=1 Tax=Niabella hibiscisoli TaxID=1825928 RepID=UPI001F0DA304|nr:SRPBCC domain-containing protein [Niabella hibiscisoli]MCH5719511.1 SRPBCC domain-containing protein [Niabella hibiscisoli]